MGKYSDWSDERLERYINSLRGEENPPICSDLNAAFLLWKETQGGMFQLSLEHLLGYATPQEVARKICELWADLRAERDSQ